MAADGQKGPAPPRTPPRHGVSSPARPARRMPRPQPARPRHACDRYAGRSGQQAGTRLTCRHPRLFRHTRHRPRLDPCGPGITQPRRTSQHLRLHGMSEPEADPGRLQRTGPPARPTRAQARRAQPDRGHRAGAGRHQGRMRPDAPGCDRRQKTPTAGPDRTHAANNPAPQRTQITSMRRKSILWSSVAHCS